MHDGLVEVGEMPLIKVLRFARGKSGAALMYKVGIDRGRISVIERGLDPPRPHERKLLARALKVRADQVDARVRLFIEMPAPRVAAAAGQ